MADIAQRNFAGGILSPDLFFRADQVKYLTGCREATNFFIRKSGGLSNRAGTRFVAECETQGSPTGRRLLKFIFSDQDTYVLEFTSNSTSGYMRVVRNGALVQIPGLIALPWSVSTTYSAGESVSYLGNVYVALRTTIADTPSTSPLDWVQVTAGIFRTVVQKISRFAPNDYSWRFEAYDFNPKSQPPSGSLTITSGGGGGSTSDYLYAVTTIKTVDFEESLPLTGTLLAAHKPTTNNPHMLTWSAVADAAEYYVYKAVNGKLGFIGAAAAIASPTFSDIGYDPDTSLPPPTNQTIFNSTGNYPSIVAFIQQRLCFAATDTEPEKIWMSRTGLYQNFTVSLPQQDDDSISFALSGRKISRVRAMFEAGGPFVLTANVEWQLKGDADGAVLPTVIGAVQQAFNGASANVDPVIIDDTAIYVQGRGSIVRDLRYKLEDTGYEGRDLSVYCDSLFNKKQIVAWDYAQNPHSLLWVVRNDGVLLSLSYLREHEIWGWTQHTTDGYFRDVVVVPEGDLDVPYFIVERKINGVTKFYIERLNERIDDDVSQAFFVDCGLSYDGTNTTSTTIKVINGPSITVNDVVAIESSVSLFSASDIGNAFVLYRYDADGNLVTQVTITIQNYLTPTLVEGIPSQDMTGPSSVESGRDWFVENPITTWAKAVDQFTNLGHLEGKNVAILADGAVVANGYEEPYYTVSSGSVTIPRPAVIAHIGLPYIADFESLDVEAKDGNTVRHKPQIVTHVGVLVKDTSALKAGSNFSKMTEYKIRDEEAMGEPTRFRTGFFDVSVSSSWDEESRVCIRQDNPLPVTLSGIIPRYVMG